MWRTYFQSHQILEVEVNKEFTVTVTAFNTGPERYNISGSLHLELWKSSDGVNFIPVDDKDMFSIEENKSRSVSFKLTFSEEGTWYIKIKISSSSPIDIIEGQTHTDVTPYESPVKTIEAIVPKEIGIGPYLLIITMVILVLYCWCANPLEYKEERKAQKVLIYYSFTQIVASVT